MRINLSLTSMATCAVAGLLVFASGCGDSSGERAGSSAPSSAATRAPRAERTPATAAEAPPEQAEQTASPDVPSAAAGPGDATDVDQSSLASVVVAIDLRMAAGDVDGAWELVDPSCRPRAIKALWEKLSIDPDQLPTATRDEWQRQVRKSVREERRDVVYLGGEGAERKGPLATTPADDADAARVDSHDKSGQALSINARYVKVDGRWWLDAREGVPGEGLESQPEYRCNED